MLHKPITYRLLHPPDGSRTYLIEAQLTFEAYFLILWCAFYARNNLRLTGTFWVEDYTNLHIFWKTWHADGPWQRDYTSEHHHSYF